MSKYLDRLHALESEKNAYIGNPQNPQKPFEPFEGRQEGRFSGAQPPFEPFEGSCSKGKFQPAPIQAPASLEDRRASVEATYAQMEAERERRRDWYAQPVEGWRDGRLTLRNIARDETVVIDLWKWKAGR